MKPESLKAIQELANYASMYCSQIGLENSKHIQDELARIIRIETPVCKNPKFDFYKYAKKDDMRPAMCGIFHDKGQKVVSDGQILIAKKEDYPEEYEGKILGKDGNFIDWKFPDYESIFPNPKIAYTEHEVDFGAFADFVLQTKATAKLRGSDTSFAFVQIGDSYFQFKFFQLFVSYMKEIGAKTIWTAIGGRRACYVEANGSRGVLMPILEPRNNPDNSILKM